MYWQLEALTKQTWLCHGKILRQEGVTGGFPNSEVCPELFMRCPGGRTLGFFHDTHVRLLVWAIQYSLAASGGFCGSNSTAEAKAQTLPGLHSKYNMHGEETNIKEFPFLCKRWHCSPTSGPTSLCHLSTPTGCHAMKRGLDARHI